MIFSMEEARDNSVSLLEKIFAPALVFIVLFTYIKNRFLKPYMHFLLMIKESLKKANKGDYSSGILIVGSDETIDVFKWLNSLLEKLGNTIGAIDKNLSLFIADRRITFSDPLAKSQSIVEDISNIYRFKRTIEQDISKDDIYSLAMLDIDFFKKANDTLGHDAGDTTLKGLTDIFSRSIKPEDIAFRFGGKEFIVFMPDVKQAQKTIQSIKDNFEDTTFNLNGQSLNKTLSAGIANFKNDGTSPWQIIKYADVAMYEAKNTGRNKIVLYGDIEKEKTNLKNDQEY